MTMATASPKIQNRFGRAGVPLYVLYYGPGRATVLPEVLTLDGVMAALGAPPI